ncbi:MAG: AAA family ATPase [Paludibacteraceae bacterium]|nr:AAA family ATPase [Paludibacteraceae bacterium]
MKLKSLAFDNFRGFKKYKINFSSRATVLIGQNGAGKSTIINGIHKSLSFIFSKSKDNSLMSGKTVANLSEFTTQDFYFNTKKRVYEKESQLSANAAFGERVLKWTYSYDTINNSIKFNGYKDALTEFLEEWNEQTGKLPVYAYFSDSYPHINAEISKREEENISQTVMPQFFAYNKWNEEESCTQVWETRLCNQLNNRNSANHSGVDMNIIRGTLEYKETAFIEEKLKKFNSFLFPEDESDYLISYLSSVLKDKTLYLQLGFKNGRTSLLQQLPAGYRRLYSMVIDIAYRSFILGYEKIDPTGIVLIDEMDLHLHPSLEQKVLQCLMDTFPKIQFVVSTHSVGVIGNLNVNEENSVVVIGKNPEYAVLLPNVYGVDYNSILRDFMGTPSKNELLGDLVEKYKMYKNMELNNECNTILEKIIEKVGSEHSIVKELQGL